MQLFSRIPDESISSLGEKRLIRHISEWLGSVSPPSPEGMGDDCALLPQEAVPTRLVTTDSVVLGRHFTEATAPGLVGQKLLRRNLSDIAAMGGMPTIATLSCFLPPRLRISWLQGFFTGLSSSALRYGVKVVGGDLAQSSEDLAINLTLLGAGKGPFLLRHGARAGDVIASTGKLGGASLERHLHIFPRLKEGQCLAASGDVTSCIDISDGLAIDLAQLLGDFWSALLDMDQLPVHEDAIKLAESSGKSPAWHCLNDGEDHELLFTVPPSAWDSLRKDFISEGLNPPLAFGTIAPRKTSLILNAATGEPVSNTGGYEHFRAS